MPYTPTHMRQLKKNPFVLVAPLPLQIMFFRLYNRAVGRAVRAKETAIILNAGKGVHGALYSINILFVTHFFLKLARMGCNPCRHDDV